MQRNRFSIAKLLPTRLVLIAALVMAAFVHSPATHSAIEQAKFAAAYTLPDGSTPILCDTTDNGERTGFESCAFCIIASNASLNGADHTSSCVIVFIAEAVRFDTVLSAAAGLEQLLTTSAPRAPPYQAA